MTFSQIYGVVGNGVLAANAELNGLPNNGIAICSGETWSNVYGDSQGGGFPDAILGRLYLSAPAAVYSGSPAVYGWILSLWDGSTYETLLNGLTSSSGSSATTSSTAPLPRSADFIWGLNIDSSVKAQTRDIFSARPAPICPANYLVVWNQSGEALATAATNAIALYFNTQKIG